VDIFFPDRPWKINRQLVRMWGRIIPVYDFVYWIVWANWGNPLMAKHSFSPDKARDTHGLLNDAPPPSSFTKQEEDRGAMLLREMGIPPGSPIVCFHARDKAFLKTLKAGNWEYHDFRNANIDTYVPAIKELVSRGYYAIRMGKIVNHAFPWQDSHVIDYATSFWRSDFADLYLVSRCRFYIGTSCGFDAVAEFFRKPQVVLNVLPVGNVSSWSLNYLNIPKKLWLTKEQRFLKFQEIIHSEVGLYQEASQYEQAGIEIINNTPEEILDVVIEREERLRGFWKTTDEYEYLQQRFWKLYKPSDIHGVLKARIGSQFLLQNKDLLN
jgi:putative glycosyltransferase (TIGR04372 family)